ncbi:MAG: hypothetical protein JNJ46_32240 [Myxococcales bacterium]|nr:hypothetical protein [Myxococcales bacterium]
MGAIDLLFDVKRDSERLHQLVLGALLSRTALVDRLVPGRGAAGARGLDDTAGPQRKSLVFDPLGKAFDLGVIGHGARVLVEVKLDAPVSEDHLAQQLGRMQDGDHLLLLLLGYSALTTDRVALRERIARIGHHSQRPDLLDRVSLRDASDLIPLLSDPTLLSPASPALPASIDPDSAQRDARDLAMAYRDALWSLQERLRSFSARPVDEWGEAELYGFYAACRQARGDDALRIGRMASADGSVLGCRVAQRSVRRGRAQLDLAFEGTLLCLRFLPQPGQSEPRKQQREAASEALRRVGLSLLEPDLRWVEAAPRMTAVMTLATCEVLLAFSKAADDAPAHAAPHRAAIFASDVQPGGRIARSLAAAEQTLNKLAALLAD